MKSVFLDTSIFIRFFSKDDVRKAEQCISLFKRVELGALRPYTSNIVLQEIHYVLLRRYRFPKAQILGDLQRILRLRNMTLVEKTDTPAALNMLSKYNVNYGDCLIATQIPKRVVLVSYDKDFDKLGILRKEPSELLQKRGS